jgi:hypothetical protein
MNTLLQRTIMISQHQPPLSPSSHPESRPRHA